MGVWGGAETQALIGTFCIYSSLATGQQIALGRILGSSGPGISHLYNGNSNGAYLRGNYNDGRAQHRVWEPKQQLSLSARYSVRTRRSHDEQN